jgi:hypothetical protein
MGDRAVLINRRRLDDAEYVKLFKIDENFQSNVKAFLKANNYTVDGETFIMYPWTRGE